MSRSSNGLRDISRNMPSSFLFWSFDQFPAPSKLLSCITVTYGAAAAGISGHFGFLPAEDLVVALKTRGSFHQIKRTFSTFGVTNPAFAGVLRHPRLAGGGGR